MIGKISARGSRVAGLLYYLYGPGRNEAHTDPHLVAGWRAPAELEPALRQDSRRDFRRLAGLLQQPDAALGPRGFERPVWHCSIRTAPQDRILADREWAQVARDVMHRTGLAPHGQDDEAIRWVALRHAPDHIHLVAVLARQDGARPRFWNDYYRVGEACRAAEQRLGLRRTAPRDRTAGSRPTRGGVGEGPPPRPLRTAPDHAPPGGERRGRRLVRRTRVLRPARAGRGGGREAVQHPRPPPGHRVRRRLAHRHGPERRAGLVQRRQARPGPDLPKLRHRWNGQVAGPAGRPAAPLTPAERTAIWDHVTRTAAAATEQIRQLSVTDPGRAADAAWAAADTFHAAASALGSRVLRQAAESYARAARAPYGRVPYRTRAGDGLRGAARLLSLAAPATGDPVLAQIVLIVRLIALAQAVAGLRAAQRHAAQAAAARAAARRLHTARCAYERRPASQRAQERAQAPATGEAFPFSIRDVMAREAEAAHTRAPAFPRQASPAMPRQRGPTR